MYNYVSHSEEETVKIARDLAENISKGDIIVLSGELGSGKTKFVEGFLSYFGLENEVSSPTFTILNEYTSEDTNIYHFDIYRLKDSDEFYNLGFFEYFDKGISLIEWGEMIENIIPKSYIKVTFLKDESDENTRYINIHLKEFYA